MKNKQNGTAPPRLVHALEIGVAWVAEAQGAGQEDEARQASEAFLRLAELAFESGITVGSLVIEPKTPIDGRRLGELIAALRNGKKPHLRLVKSNQAI